MRKTLSSSSSLLARVRVPVDDGDAVAGVGTNALNASSRRSIGRCHAGFSVSFPAAFALPFCRWCVFGFARFVGGGEQDDDGVESWLK